MTIFDIISTLESTSKCTVNAHVTNNELLVEFNSNTQHVNHVFTDVDVENWTVSQWSSIGGDVKLKMKSAR